MTTGKDNAFEVNRVITEIAAKFRSFGRTLGLRASKLNTISKNSPLDAKDALGQVIDKWIEQHYNVELFGLPTWRTLVKAVDLPAGGNNHLLAKRIATDHPGIPQLPTILIRIHGYVFSSYPSKASFGSCGSRVSC